MLIPGVCFLLYFAKLSANIFEFEISYLRFESPGTC